MPLTIGEDKSTSKIMSRGFHKANLTDKNTRICFNDVRKAGLAAMEEANPDNQGKIIKFTKKIEKSIFNFPDTDILVNGQDICNEEEAEQENNLGEEEGEKETETTAR